MSTPGGLAGVEQGVAPSASTVMACSRKETVPPSPVTSTDGRNRSVCRRSAMPRAAKWSSRASSMPVGPQAQVSRSARSGTSAASPSVLSMPSTSVCFSTSRIAPSAASARSSPAKMTSSDGRRRVDDDDVVELGDGPAQHPHHGGDAAAGGDEQGLRRPRVRQHEVAAAWSS
jgi:hypothetical protein